MHGVTVNIDHAVRLGSIDTPEFKPGGSADLALDGLRRLDNLAAPVQPPANPSHDPHRPGP